jgi:hypothetical protein
MESTLATGVSKLYEWGGLVTVLVLLVLTLAYYIKELNARNNALVDQIIKVIQDNTQIITRFTEKIDALSRKD